MTQNYVPPFTGTGPDDVVQWARTASTQINEAFRKQSFPGSIYVWNEGCVNVPTNTNEAGAEEIVFTSPFPGNGTVLVTIKGASGGITASLNGTSLGTFSDADTSSEIRYERFVTDLVEGFNSFKIWSTTSDAGELRRLEIWRNHVLDTLDTASTVATNFNSRNDRDASAVTNPTIASDGTAVDDTTNTDGSSNISLEWSWGGDESDIDGFVIYFRESSSASAYVMGTTEAEESTYFVPAAKRAAFIFGVSTDSYYTFGVQAYRIVDPDVDASGLISSDIVQPSRTEEDPYRPSATVTFAGDISGTIASASDASNLVKARSRNINNLIENPGAEDNTLEPHFEQADGGGTGWDAIATTIPFSGAHAFRYRGSGQSALAALDLNGQFEDRDKHVSCAEGDQFLISTRVRNVTSSTPNRVRIQTLYRDPDGVSTSSTLSEFLTATTTYQQLTHETTAAGADTAYVQWRIRVENDGNGSDTDLRIDGIYAIQKRDVLREINGPAQAGATKNTRNLLTDTFTLSSDHTIAFPATQDITSWQLARDGEAPITLVSGTEFRFDEDGLYLISLTVGGLVAPSTIPNTTSTDTYLVTIFFQEDTGSGYSTLAPREVRIAGFHPIDTDAGGAAVEVAFSVTLTFIHSASANDKLKTRISSAIGGTIDDDSSQLEILKLSQVVDS
jgi:hypothetical protein